MTENNNEESVMTAWQVKGKVDYNKLINQFGAQMIDDNLKDKFKRITGKELHPWIRRGIFFSHRDLDKFLDAYENGEPVYLYTGRGATSYSMHIGHTLSFLLIKWLQDVFDNCPLVIQMADDEKYAFKDIDFDILYKLGFENAKDIIAFGFNPEKTFIFSNRDYRLNVKKYEELVSTMKVKISAKEISKVFGFGEKVNVVNEKGESEEKYVFNENITVAMMDWPFYQLSAAFSQAFPHIFNGKPAHCLVLMAVDQDVYFRVGRTLADKMNILKPCSMMCKFIDPLTGPGKMSSSVSQESTIFLTDDEKTIRQKIMKYAFSGGGGNGSIDDHRKYGGNPEVDIACKFLNYFEYDDVKLAEIENEFRKGNLSCSDTKKLLGDKLVQIILEHQEKRKLVTDEVLQEFYKLKPMKLPEPKKKRLTEQEQQLYKVFDELDINYSTIYHNKIETIEHSKEIAKKLTGQLCKNLLLQDSNNYYLYVTDINTIINMKTVAKNLGLKKIRFAEKTKFKQLLNVEQDYTTLFTIINDSNKQIKIIIDDTIKKKSLVSLHPMRNDATSSLHYDDLVKFLKHYNYQPIFIQS